MIASINKMRDLRHRKELLEAMQVSLRNGFTELAVHFGKRSLFWKERIDTFDYTTIDEQEARVNRKIAEAKKAVDNLKVKN